MKVKKLNKDDIIHNKRHPIIIVIVALILSVLIAVASFLFFRSSESKAVLQVGDTTLTKAQEQVYIDSAKKMGLDDEKIREQLIEYLKNRHVAKLYDLPTNKLFINEQWSSVVSERSTDSRAAEKLFRFGDEEWAHVLKYNKLYHVLSRSLTQDALVGAVYHVPYSSSDKKLALQTLNEVRKVLSEADASSLRRDQDLLSKVINTIPQASASKSGAYLLFNDSSGLRMGGTFGVRGGTIPLDMTNRLFSQKLPIVSEVVDVNESELYLVHISSSISADVDFQDKLDWDKQKVRVVEYDK